MKLPVLFAKYLYQHKQLNLPGIGVFQVDASVSLPDNSEKNTSDFVQHIKYTQQAVLKPDDAFIDFIRTQTGKIKPLAESDLESFLEDGKNMLNIGKPFHLEGIGSLYKIKGGVYEFTPGVPLTERMEHSIDNESDQFRRNKTTYEDRYNSSSGQQTGLKKLLVVAGVLVGLTAVIWGGYSFYNRNTASGDITESDSVGINNQPVLEDSTQNRIDSTTLIKAAPVNDGTYKFIIESTDKKVRAMKRYAQLKELGTKIILETQDSLLFKLLYILPAQAKDTARIKDSLRLRYGKRVIVE